MFNVHILVMCERSFVRNGIALASVGTIPEVSSRSTLGDGVSYRDTVQGQLISMQDLRFSQQ